MVAILGDYYWEEIINIYLQRYQNPHTTKENKRKDTETKKKQLNRTHTSVMIKKCFRMNSFIFTEFEH